MFGAFHAGVVEILTQTPAFLEQNITELLDVLHDARPFASAGIEPDARAGKDARRFREASDHALVPPDRRRERRELSKSARQLQTDLERDQPTERRSAQPRVGRPGKSAVLVLGKGQYFFG